MSLLLPMFLFVLLTVMGPRILVRVVECVDPEALRWCGNVHRINVHELTKVNASFEENGCTLKCFIDEKWTTESLNESYPCSSDGSKICLDGRCVDSLAAALHECTRLHQINFTRINHAGTGYINGGCRLQCAIEGVIDGTLGEHNRNDGFSCTMGGAGFCKDGICSGHNNNNSHDQPTTTTTTTHVTVSPVTPNVSSHAHDAANRTDPHSLSSITITVDHAELRAAHANLHAGICLFRGTDRGCRTGTICYTHTLKAALQKPSWQFTCPSIAIESQHPDNRIFVEVLGAGLYLDDDFSLSGILSAARYNQTSGRSLVEGDYHMQNNFENGTIRLGIEFAYIY